MSGDPNTGMYAKGTSRAPFVCSGLILLLMSCSPETTGRTCSDDTDCFGAERCVSQHCLQSSEEPATADTGRDLVAGDATSSVDGQRDDGLPSDLVDTVCTAQTEGTVISAERWGDCTEFATSCAERGSQTRDVLICRNATRVSSTQSQGCIRDTDGDLCSSGRCLGGECRSAACDGVVSVFNISAAACSGCAVTLFTRDWSLLGAVLTDDMGRAHFDEVVCGQQVRFEVTYRNEALDLDEFWHSSEVLVLPDTGSFAFDAVRDEPYVESFRVAREDTDTDVTGGSVPAGTPLVIEIVVRNQTAVDVAVFPTLDLRDALDRGWSNVAFGPANEMLIEAGGTRIWRHMLTATQGGEALYERHVRVYKARAGGDAQDVLTDSWQWGEFVRVDG